MNHLLLDPSELDKNLELTLDGERAKHLRRILKVKVGDTIRVGLLDGLVGEAKVLRLEGFTVHLACVCDQLPPERGSDTLLLALARPKVLLRCLEHAAALGFGQIILFRSQRVEKSQLNSSAMQSEVMSRHIRHGLIQSRRTYRPQIHIFPEFTRLLEPELSTLIGKENRFLADPGGREEAALSRVNPTPLTVTIGPEGGFIPSELESLQGCGFQLVRAGTQPLRVETALSYLTGQLRAARSFGTRSIEALDQ